LKKKIENALTNTNGFSSNEKHIEYILIIPINLLKYIFTYVQSIHTTIGTKILPHNVWITKNSYKTKELCMKPIIKKQKKINNTQNIFDILNDIS